MTSASMITREEAAEILGCPPKTVSRLCHEGRLRGRKVARPAGGGETWSVEQGSVVERVTFEAGRVTRRPRRGGAA